MLCVYKESCPTMNRRLSTDYSFLTQWQARCDLIDWHHRNSFLKSQVNDLVGHIHYYRLHGYAGRGNAVTVESVER